MEFIDPEELNKLYNECMVGGTLHECRAWLRDTARKPNETLTEWADRLRATLSPQATDAE